MQHTFQTIHNVHEGSFILCEHISRWLDLVSRQYVDPSGRVVIAVIVRVVRITALTDTVTLDHSSRNRVVAAELVFTEQLHEHRKRRTCTVLVNPARSNADLEQILWTSILLEVRSVVHAVQFIAIEQSIIDVRNLN